MEDKLDKLMQVRRLIKRMERMAGQVKELEPSFEWRWSFVTEGSGGWSEELEQKAG